jgi:hypothetical protein
MRSVPVSPTNYDHEPKISFGIIVLNGEPFVKYSLRALYDSAHEIILVEGATKNAKAISTPDGHSLDSTLTSINEFIRDEDKDKKVKLITRDGFWEEKTQMSQAFASTATGNYLWELGMDEFYLEEDLKKVISILKNDPSITAISFKMKSFWGGIDYTDEGPIFGDIDRLFKFGPGYRYTEHRPPTVIDDRDRNLRNLKMIDGTTMEKYGIYMHHYYLIFPFQAKNKSIYYASTFNRDFQKWAKDNYFRLGDPYHVNDNFWSISWLSRYEGKHPEQISKMMSDIRNKIIDVAERNNADIEKLLKSPIYVASTNILRFYFNLVFRGKRLIKKIIKL